MKRMNIVISIAYRTEIVDRIAFGGFPFTIFILICIRKFANFTDLFLSVIGFSVHRSLMQLTYKDKQLHSKSINSNRDLVLFVRYIVSTV